MALSGTLKDFGIADILQLIGNQTKTGRLLLRNSKDEVEVFFVDGNVVFASEKERKETNLLGTLLLKAEVLAQEKLEEALQIQQRTLKRLGDILVESGAVSRQQLAQMMRLQTTETLYKLFGWKSGSYEFHPEEVDKGKSTFDPIRAESVLLEGFRRVDEWPQVRKRVPWTDATFEILQELDATDLPPLDAGVRLDGANDDGTPGDKHKLLYRLASAGKTVQQVVDASRIGDFEARKGLQELIEWGYLKAIAAAKGPRAVAQELGRGSRSLAAGMAVLRLGLSLGFFLATLLLVRWAAPVLGATRPEGPARRGSAQKLLSRDQVVRLESALELYRAEHGEYPTQLRQLVEGQVVSEADLRYPYREPYYYRRTQQGFVLLPPLD